MHTESSQTTDRSRKCTPIDTSNATALPLHSQPPAPRPRSLLPHHLQHKIAAFLSMQISGSGTLKNVRALQQRRRQRRRAWEFPEARQDRPVRARNPPALTTCNTCTFICVSRCAQAGCNTCACTCSPRADARRAASALFFSLAHTTTPLISCSCACVTRDA